MRPLASYRWLGFDGAGGAVVRMLGAAGLYPGLLAVDRIGWPTGLGFAAVCPLTGLGAVDRVSKPPRAWPEDRSVVFELRVAPDDCD